MKTMKIIVLLILIPLIIGCSNSSDDSQESNETITQTTQEEVNPAGVWIGYQTIITENGRGVFDMKTLIYDGKFYGVSEDAEIFFSGSYEMLNDKYLVSNGNEDSNTSYSLYDMADNGNSFAKGVMALDIKTQKTFKGAFENSIAQEGHVEAYFSTLYERSASLDYIDTVVKTDKLDMTVNASGVLSGTKDGCQISGNIEVPNSDVNIYKLSYTLSSCSNSGIYDGLGIIALDNNNSAYFMGFSSDNKRMESLAYKLDNTPVEFFKSEESNVSGWTDSLEKKLSKGISQRDLSTYNIVSDDKFYKLFYEKKW